MALLATEALEAFYGDFQALFGVSLAVDESEIVSIIGANGAGKTTLIRAICGLNAHKRGSILFDGADIAGKRADTIAKQGVAVVPEGRRLFPSLTVEENLTLGMAAGRRGHWTMARVYELFPALAELRGILAPRISGGQQQMVAIGRALLANPRVLLCDELSLGLAPRIIGDIYAQLEQIRRSGIAILLVDQDVSRALSVASRIYCLLEGRISLEGSATEFTLDQISQAYFGR